jgi:hypothetical protein
MGNSGRKDAALEPGDRQPSDPRHGKAVVIPIRTTLGEQSNKREDVTKQPGDILGTLTTLRWKLRCVNEAILSIERLAAHRLAEKQGRSPKWKPLAMAEDRLRYKRRIGL